MIDTDTNSFLTIKKLAEKYNVTGQAVYMAFKQGYIKSRRVGNVWFLSEKDYIEYRAQKHNRHIRSRYNGGPLYDEHELSPRQCAKLYGYHDAYVYSLVRKGKLPHQRRGAAIILKYADCVKLFGQVNEEQQTFL
jgi:hypothetical protein